MKLWRPKDPRAITLIKLTLWSGLATWVVLTLTLSFMFARQFALLAPTFLSSNWWGHLLGQWVGPTWVVFTTLMLIWAVVRFTNKKLRPKPIIDVDFKQAELRALAELPDDVDERDV